MEPLILARTTGMPKQKWLGYHQGSVGGSDAHTVVGLNRFKTVQDLYMDKVGLAPPFVPTEAVWLGVNLEAPVADRFTEETGIAVERRPFIYQHPEHPWMTANIDRAIVGRNAGLEIKTTSTCPPRIEQGEVPAYYALQCIHYMSVMGADHWYLAVLVIGKGMHVVRLERDEEQIDALIAAEEQFWTDSVVKRIPPTGPSPAATAYRQRYSRWIGTPIRK